MKGGVPWTMSEQAKLIRLTRSNYTVKEIANELGRSQRAVARRKYDLCITNPRWATVVSADTYKAAIARNNAIPGEIDVLRMRIAALQTEFDVNDRVICIHENANKE
jgi:hypothetical protein